MVDKIQGLNSTASENVKSLDDTSLRVEGKHQDSHASQQKNQVHAQKAFEELAKKLEDFQKVVKTSFKYEILKDPDMIVLKVVNDDNGEVVRQIPPKEAVRLAKAIDELLGLFVDKHV